MSVPDQQPVTSVGSDLHRPGSVALVGAGPGDPGLLTLRGQECLAAATVVLYDDLVDTAILGFASAGAECRHVGKRGGERQMEQADINHMMVELACAGHCVVRLKGGDPWLFGRGGEEAQALVDAGVSYEVVPGVSSALAVPAYAGIPVTHRGMSSAVHILTGVEGADKPNTDVPWDALARSKNTIVCLMGTRRLSSITEALIRHGRRADELAAVIQWGTQARQRTVTATLETLPEAVAAVDLQPPTVIVVGEVVSLRDHLTWFDQQPLFGCRVLVTRPLHQAASLTALLRRRGAHAVVVPTQRIEWLTPPKHWSDVLRDMALVDWLVFTSANGVDACMGWLRDAGRDIRALNGPRLAAIGIKTAARLETFGCHVDVVPCAYTSVSLAEALIQQGVEGAHVMLMRAKEATAVLPRMLEQAGATVTELMSYHAVPVPWSHEQLEMLMNEACDAVTFTSAENARQFLTHCPSRVADTLTEQAIIASIGPVTSEALRAAGWPVHVEATEATMEALVEALSAHGDSERHRSMSTPDFDPANQWPRVAEGVA